MLKVETNQREYECGINKAAQIVQIGSKAFVEL